MNFYMAFGTIDFLIKLQEKHRNENMTAFYNNETAILLHETTKKSVFAAPRKYEVLTAIGEIESAKFSAFTYIPVTEEGKPLFEYNITQMSSVFQNSRGFIAFRALKPIKSDTFVVVSFWEKESFYLDWTHSNSFEQLDQFIQKTKAGLNQTIFSGPVYTKTYHSISDD
ncbi:MULTISPECIES: antibiotic biosynthesis monooxygenase family protein [unclassified Fredinandcohnia]|uniref:antibiotic biosynthesis monooxygenase family protein n=1 Tax=unclassified Fredinandcohnia TaxID=2837514 RepID=UPI0030FD79E3